MADDPVLLDVSPEGLAVVRLNRPDKRNAFDEAMIAALADAFETLKGADAVRMVLLRGAGQHFSVGADLEWMRRQGERDRADNEADAMDLARMLKALHDLPQLTVALVQGAAMGGGAGLVAACDVGVAMKGASFRFSEVRLGLTPANISPYVIAAIGPRRANALFATGESFDADYAEKIGLVHYTVADETELEGMAEHLARLTFSAAPGAVADAKRLVRDVAGRRIDDGLMHDTARRIAARRASDEGREGVSAFLERRKPSWDVG
ncbi:MAG: enoyl-CoA hydratase-related protein [Hyphomonadaceae bacterium]|nr:enoyl-CoA hydratase-related protein [Hyphomonadaceae bacterium]